MPGPHRLHLNSASDLVTTHEATRAGFVAMVLERNRQSSPIIEEARALHVAASRVGTPTGLLTTSGLQRSLLTAAGISEKAAGHLGEEDRREAIEALVNNFLEPAGPAFADELVYRFLLVRGDALGGTMRNLAGLTAKRKFTRSILAALQVSRLQYQWLDRKTKAWVPGDGADVDVEQYVAGLGWKRDGGNRVMIYDSQVPLLRKNIDVCLLHVEPRAAAIKAARRVPEAYVALGEVKGGIDPAGADEHWKTANSALSRIRSGFAGASWHPSTFLVAGAIVANMASEIWAQLESSHLTNAANLTDANQLASISRWLVEQ